VAPLNVQELFKNPYLQRQAQELPREFLQEKPYNIKPFKMGKKNLRPHFLPIKGWTKTIPKKKPQNLGERITKTVIIQYLQIY